MSRDFLKISSTLAHNLKKYFDNPNSGLSDIQRWFNENIRGDDQLIANRSKVSAIWLYKQLKQYKPNILDQKLIKEALDKQLKLEAAQIVDYFTSQQDSEKIILLYYKYKQGYKSLKTGQEVHRQVSQLRKTINKSIAEHLKVNLDIDNIKEITNAQFKQKIFNKIHEQRLDIIKDYLKDIGYNNQVTPGTIDEIKNIIQSNGLTDSKLGEYIEQIYNQEVINKVTSDTESEDTSYRTSDSSTNDRTEYNKLIKKIKHKAEEQLKKPINKVLLEIDNNASQKHGLRIIKLYGINNLKIDLEVNEQTIINKVSIKRNGGGNKQDNHTVPVSTFLKSLEKNLKNKKLTEVIIKNLLHHYGKYLQDSISNPEQRREPQHTSEFDWIKDKISDFDSKILDQKSSIVEKYIIPFIFYEWNTRVEASFRAVKEATAYGVEGNLIKKINKQFNELIKSLKKEEIQSINNLKEKINEILPEYCKSIDLPPESQLTPKRLGVVISDARRLLKIWFSLLENVDENLGLRSLLDSNGSNDYKSFKEEFFNRQKFGEQIIDSKQQLTRQQKQKLKNKLNEYIVNNPETVDSWSEDSESDQSSSSGALSPGRDEDVDVILEKVEQAPIKVEYTYDKIKLILQHYLPQKNIEQVYLIDAPDQYHSCIDNLKQQLIQETKDKIVFSDKFYVVIERSNEQNIISSVILLKLSNKGNKNQLEILPITDSADTADLFKKQLKSGSEELKKLRMITDDIPEWYNSQLLINISNLIEIIKLSIECNAPCEAGDNEIEEIMSESSIEYEKTHKSILDQVSRVSTGEQPGTSGILKRKGTGSDSPAKKVKFNLESLEEQRDNIDLQASGSSCSTRLSSKKRLKRDLCQEKATEEIFPYEPLEENVIESSKFNARLYAQIVYLVALEHPEPTNPNIKPDNILTYTTNIGDIISEGEVNHSLREQELLQTHYLEAQDFCNTYPKDTVLDLVGPEIDSSSRAWIFDNGKHSLLVSYDGNRYQIYSPDLNYRQSFQTKEGVRFTDIELYAEAFFKWHSNSIEYDLFTLKSNIPEEITTQIKQAKFWHPDEVVSDLVLLDKGSFANIEGIPAKVIRELFFLDGKVPELTALHENFFAQYSGKISIRIEELHNVLSFLDPQASKSLVALVKHHNFRVDTAYLNNMPESTKSLLHSYRNEISNKLKTSESITIQDLSDLSWQVLTKEMIKNSEISSELRELSLQSVKELHSVAATRAHALGITSQTLFFLPDIIRSMNTGNFEGLQKTGEMMLGDMALNKMYGSLISKLESVLPESRIKLLKKLPLTSPIFKVLTIHSIIELHKQLNNLPADSEEAGIIKHQLGEQYFTIGLMVAELFGLELGPLWIGLMAEQLVYGAIALRKQYHLDIPFGEAFLMNLGFEQDKLQSILTERQLVDLNLSLVDRLSAQTNTSYGLVVVKVPKMLYDEAHPGNSVIEFKPKDSHFCIEDNVFLENSSGYKRISSVISDEQNNNCVETAPLQISGNSLTALYSNNNSTEWQSIYVNFDPNEGDMKLHFTKEGLSRLDSSNNHQQSNTNATRPYVVTAQIYHKPYPDKIGLFGNKNHSFLLNDDSKLVASNYYIDGTSSFGLEDNSISTSIKFLNNKLFKGYNAYISGNTSDMQVRSIYSDDITGHIVLKNKDYLKLNLEHLLINGKLTIDIPNTEILYAKGAMLQHNHLSNNNIIEVSPNVITFKILLEVPSISRIDIKNKNASDVIINMQHLNNKAFTLSIQGIHTEYKSYYTFEVVNLQLVLDEMTFTNRDFPQHFIILCSSRGSVKGWCKINNDPIKNIISIKGKIDERDGILTIEDKKSILEIVKNTNKLPQDNKHVEVVNYDNVVKLEDNLRFNQVLENSNYNSSAYYNYLNKHNFTNWHIIEFNSSNSTTLYHFKYSNIQINDINYFIKENKIYATLKDNIDGSKLLKDNKGKSISIFVNKTLSNSQISLEDLKEDSLEINNATLHNLSDNIIFVFQKSGGGIFPLSLRLLKDSFKYIKSDSGQEYSTSLMNQNQTRFIVIERNISLSSGNNLEQLQVISTTYDKKINENPYHIHNNDLTISQYGNNSSIHKVMLSNELGTQHINIILNTSCNTFSAHCFTSQYEFNCLNTPIKIKDNTNSSSIVLYQHNYISSTNPQIFHIQCNDNIVSEISLSDKQNLVLHNPLIYDQLTVDAKNVTILDAISVGDSGSFITVKDNTKDFKITAKGLIHITKNYGTNYRESIIRTEPGEIENDIQLIYEYTEKNNTRIYTVMLEHINERFFQDIQVKDTNTSRLIHFGTPKTKYDWYNRDNGIKSILRIKVKLPDSKIGTLLINGTTYILNVYNQDEELVLQEIKYQNLQNCSPNTEGLVFKNKLLNCIESYFCYYNFSPLSHIEQEQYLNLSDVSVFWSQDNNHKVLVHYPHCYFMDESKSSENLEHKNVEQGSSHVLDQAPSKQYHNYQHHHHIRHNNHKILHGIDKQLLNNNTSINRIQRAADLFEEARTIEQQVEIEAQDQHTTSSASKVGSPINSIANLIKKEAYALLPTTIIKFYPQDLYNWIQKLCNDASLLISEITTQQEELLIYLTSRTSNKKLQHTKDILSNSVEEINSLKHKNVSSAQLDHVTQKMQNSIDISEYGFNEKISTSKGNVFNINFLKIPNTQDKSYDTQEKVLSFDKDGKYIIWYDNNEKVTNKIASLVWAYVFKFDDGFQVQREYLGCGRTFKPTNQFKRYVTDYNNGQKKHMHIIATQKQNLACLNFNYIEKFNNIDQLPNWVLTCSKPSLLELSQPSPKLPELGMLEITDQNTGLILHGINIHSMIDNVVKTMLPTLNIFQRSAVTVPIETVAVLSASYICNFLSISLPASKYMKVMLHIPSAKHYFDVVKQYLIKNDIIKQYIPEKYNIYADNIENIVATGFTLSVIGITTYSTGTSLALSVYNIFNSIKSILPGVVESEFATASLVGAVSYYDIASRISEKVPEIMQGMKALQVVSSLYSAARIISSFFMHNKIDQDKEVLVNKLYELIEDLKSLELIESDLEEVNGILNKVETIIQNKHCSVRELENEFKKLDNIENKYYVDANADNVYDNDIYEVPIMG